MTNLNNAQIRSILNKIWKPIFRSTVIVFMLVVLGIGLFILRMIPEDTTFHSEYTRAGIQAAVILERHGLCQHGRCRSSGIVFTSGLDRGMDIKINGIKDSSILEEITSIFIKTFADTLKMKHTIIEVRPVIKQTKLPAEQPFTIELRRD
jgi:hypothetical protein